MIWVFKGCSQYSLAEEAPDGLYDYIYLATPTNFGVVQITWDGMPRDEQLVKKIILSIKETLPEEM